MTITGIEKGAKFNEMVIAVVFALDGLLGIPNYISRENKIKILSLFHEF